MQPPTPVVAIDDTLTAAERDTFLTATGNQHLDDTNEVRNFIRTGRRESRLPYDTKSD